MQADADDVARFRAERDPDFIQRARLGAEDGGPQLLLLARLALFRDAEGGGGAGGARGRVERGPEAQLDGRGASRPSRSCRPGSAASPTTRL
jgi:hypothetical protein